jgi:hypothetical protein
VNYAIDIAMGMHYKAWPGRVEVLINSQCSIIFNRVFEVQKSAQNAENFAEIYAFETGVSAFTMFVLTMIGAYAKLTFR